jgi:hypothetical protein
MKQLMTLMVLIVLATISAGCGDSSSPTTREESRTDKEVDDASRLCGALKGTGFTSKCKVRGFGRSVDAWIDTSGPEAIKMCREIASMLHQHTTSLAVGGWKLRIFSPFSGENVLAECSL